MATESLLKSEDRDVTKPDAITIFETVDVDEDKKEDPNPTESPNGTRTDQSNNNNRTYIKPSPRKNARKRINTTERFKWITLN